MYATLKTISDIEPTIDSASACGRFLRYPNKTGQRQAEGGLRLKNKFKHSQPGLPLVTVITTVFNNISTFDQCILSVLGQTYSNIEYIIMDAGSSDGSLELIQSYDDGIDYYISEPDTGIYSGMNKGIALATGDYILLLNSDDWYAEEAVEVLVNNTLKADADISAAHAAMIDKHGRQTAINKSIWNGKAAISCPLRHGTMLVSREIYNRNGLYDERFEVIADWVWQYKAFLSRVKVSIVDSVLLSFRSTGISMQGNPTHLAERRQTLKENLGIDEDETVDLLMKPWELDKSCVASLIKKNPGNRKLYNALYATGISHIGPKVSIMVPIYNKASFLSECLDSLVGQTLSDIEIICVDDGSTDNSCAIAKEYAKKDDRVRIIAHPINKGIIQARKTALKEAAGEFIAFVDADDFAEKDLVERLYRKALREKADFVQCNARVVDPQHILPPDLFESYSHGLNNGVECTFEGEDIFRRYTWPIRVNLCLSLFHESVFKKVIPFIKDNAPNRGDDNLLAFFFMYFARKYAFVDHVLYNYRANETSSNLNDISFDLAQSQIRGRADSIRYAKWFAGEVGLTWNNKKMPFLAFSKSIMNYAIKFIQRYSDSGGDRREELIDFFFSSFGSDARVYFFDKMDEIEKRSLNNDRLVKLLTTIKSSKSWRTTKILRWGINKVRGIP